MRKLVSTHLKPITQWASSWTLFCAYLSRAMHVLYLVYCILFLPQGIRERPTFEDVKALAIAELASGGGGAGKASGGGSVIGSPAASLATTARTNPHKDILQPGVPGRKVAGSAGVGPVIASSSRRPT